MPKHKRLKVTEETHTKIKQEAKNSKMFIDQFMIHLLDQHEKLKQFK